MLDNMLYNEGVKRSKTNPSTAFRFDRETLDILAALAEYKGTTRTGVLVQLLKSEARNLGLWQPKSLLALQEESETYTPNEE